MPELTFPPNNPVWPPPDHIDPRVTPYHVALSGTGGESFLDICNRFGLGFDDLIEFNFGLKRTEPHYMEKINWYLKYQLGCHKTTASGNFIFSGGETIYIPQFGVVFDPMTIEGTPETDKLDRKICIQKNIVCMSSFVISENPNAKGDPPAYELATFSEVSTYSPIIDRVAGEKGVDARLVKAIMYMETTHGYYDAPLDLIGKNKSIRPMNINVEYWGDIFGTREDMNNPEKNIRAGVEMLNRIQSNLPYGSVEKIATLYNNIKARTVSNYGARVKKIYDEQPWNK